MDKGIAMEVALFAVALFAVASASAALVAVGYRSVEGELLDLRRIVTRLIARVTAEATRESPTRGSISIALTRPELGLTHATSWLIVADAGSADVFPRSQIVRASSETDSTVTVTVNAPPREHVEVQLSIYDAATMTPVTRLSSIVPSTPKASIWKRAYSKLAATAWPTWRRLKQVWQ